jgi:hypothetical protein
VQIVGSGFDDATTSILVAILSVIMVALMPIAVVSGLAYDIRKPTDSHQAS